MVSPEFLYIILITTVITLVGMVWRNLSKRVDAKLDTELYKETIIHIQKGVEGISGTAQTLESLAESINNIQERFITRKEFEYELRLHNSECRAVREVARLLGQYKDEVSPERNDK